MQFLNITVSPSGQNQGQNHEQLQRPSSHDEMDHTNHGALGNDEDSLSGTPNMDQCSALSLDHSSYQEDVGDSRVVSVSNQRGPPTAFIDSHCHIDLLYARTSFKGTFATYKEVTKTTFPQNYEGCIAVFCNPNTFSKRGKYRSLLY